MQTYDVSKVENVFGSNDCSTNFYIVVDPKKGVVSKDSIVAIAWIGFGEREAREAFLEKYKGYNVEQGTLEGNNLYINCAY